MKHDEDARVQRRGLMIEDDPAADQGLSSCASTGRFVQLFLLWHTEVRRPLIQWDHRVLVQDQVKTAA